MILDHKKEQLNKNESLFGRVVHGGAWIFGLNIVNRICSFARIIILARLLAPKDFGLMGITMLVLGVMETFSKPGIQSALIQKKDKSEEYLDTAWTILMVRGIILFVILYATAPLIAMFFKTPQASNIIRVLALAKLFVGTSNIAVIYFQKELEFNKQFIYIFITNLIEVIVSIVAAVLLRSVWALVFGVLARNFAKSVISYCIHPYRPKFIIDWEKAKELFGFGKWILGSEILIFLTVQGDDFFVAKLLGAPVLGLYQMAYNISNIPTTDITRMITRVTLPAYSKLQNNIPRLRESYLRVLKFVAFLNFPIAGAIFVLAPDFTKIFLGEKWLAIVPALQILAFAGLERSIMATIGPALLAMGKPKIDTKWQIVRFLVLVSLIYSLTVKWGIAGTALAVVISNLAFAVGFVCEAAILLKFKLIKFVQAVFYPCVNGICIVLAITMLKSILPDISLLTFSVFTVVGCVIFIGSTIIFDKFFNYKMIPEIKGLLYILKG